MAHTLMIGKLKLFSRTPRCERGFTYIMLLAIVATTSVLAGVTTKITSTYIQRDTETELIFRGLQYRQAIKSYYHAAVPNAFPRSLDELIKDPRFIYRVHLKRLYLDPFTNSNHWSLLTNTEGEIIGVSSTSSRKSLKSSGFPKGIIISEGGTTYQAWKFVYTPPTPLPTTYQTGIIDSNVNVQSTPHFPLSR